jgi:hypothetical protein
MGAMWVVALIAVVLGIGLEYVTTLDLPHGRSRHDRDVRGGT